MPELPRIWIVTNPEHPDGPVRPLQRALESCRPGVIGVQLRAHGVPDRQLVAWGRELRAITADCGSPLTVNRRADIAAVVEADGVHLPERGLRPSILRSEWAEAKLVGVSRHDRAGLQEAAAEGASFAFLSPVFDVPGKAEPIGVRGFQAAIAGVGLPTYALGGIGARDIGPIVAAGAAGIAVRRAIYESEDPRRSLQALLHELDKTEPTGE